MKITFLGVGEAFDENNTHSCILVEAAGRRMLVSNNVPSNLSKGSGSNLSAAIYGRFSDLLIGQWSGIEIETDIY